MTYWYYQIVVKDMERDQYEGVMETNKEFFPMSEVNDSISARFEIDMDMITYSLIQRINVEDFHALYARDTKFNNN